MREFPNGTKSCVSERQGYDTLQPTDHHLRARFVQVFHEVQVASHFAGKRVNLFNERFQIRFLSHQCDWL